MANEFDKRYDALVEEMKASIKEMLYKKIDDPEVTRDFNGITAANDYWNILHVVEEGAHESLDVIAHTYYVVDDMILASEDIPLGIDDIYKYDDLDIAREQKKPTRIICEFNESDIELTSYEQLTLAYDNIKSVIINYINN